MSATLQSPRPSTLNRRRRVRQRVHAPAYATFGGASKSQMLQLYEVLDISEIGVAVQCPAAMEENQQVDLCLDLAEATGQIRTTARVVWSNSSGRVGLGFPPLQNADLRRLQQWLFLNAMAGAANAASSSTTQALAKSSALHPNYTDTLSAASAIQREAESFGLDLKAVLSLIVVRSNSLFRGCGAAIALVEKDSGTMTCRASAGASAPPIGATLRAGSGFSGDCVRTGSTQRCDDTDTDPRVDPETCRALGIRSVLASPIRSGEKIIGLIEVFGAEPKAFVEQDGVVLQRFAETISAAIDRAHPQENIPAPLSSEKPFTPSPGSVLFAHLPKERSPSEARSNTNRKNRRLENTDQSESSSEPDQAGGIHFPRTHLYLLVFAAATVALALGYVLAPWIQETLHSRVHNTQSTVLASSRVAAAVTASLPSLSVETANIDQLLQLARQGDPVAENALGLLYAQGDDKQRVKQDEAEAANWFTKAAEHGSVPAQYKLGLMYWGGHGLPKDANKAYFWTVLARAGGQEGSKDLAKVLANGMTRTQAAAIEQQAEIWYQQHESQAKPQPGH
jgi:putative methionine-R-sulfoxide reductase with GAF domain